MRRFHSIQDQRVRNRRKKLVKKFYGDDEDLVSKNNFRTMHPLGCSCSKCLVCHSDKILFKNRNIEVLKSNEKMREDLKFLYEDFVVR